jgi:hypothetical protein
MGQLLFKKVFWDAIRAGTKRTTVRRWPRPRVSAGSRAFAPGVGWLAVESVDEIADLARLRESDAVADGFASVGDMIETLLSLYPAHATDGKRWFRVSFHAEADLTTESTENTERELIVEEEPALFARTSQDCANESARDRAGKSFDPAPPARRKRRS